jgi:hypothetical protein
MSNDGTQHTIKVWLKYNSTSVICEKVTVKINETATCLTTGTSGFFSLTRDLKPVNNNKTTFMVTVGYNGSSPMNATAWTYTLNGTRVASCATVYFGFRSSVNGTMLTVDPQATEAALQAKTKEQLQQEAQNNGWASPPWHQFLWGYPWYRLHFPVALGDLSSDVGFNPILPRGGMWQFDAKEFLLALADVTAWEIVVEVIGLFAGYLAAKAFSIFPPTWPAAAFALGIQLFLFSVLMYQGWNNKAEMFATALVGFILLVFATEINIGKAFLETIISLVSPTTMAQLNMIESMLVGLGLPFEVTRTWVDAFEIGADIVMAITAYARYKGRI